MNQESMGNPNCSWSFRDAESKFEEELLKK